MQAVRKEDRSLWLKSLICLHGLVLRRTCEGPGALAEDVRSPDRDDSHCHRSWVLLDPPSQAPKCPASRTTRCPIATVNSTCIL